MSVLYCTIPHFPAALARRKYPDLGDRPLVLVGPEGRVWGTSAEAAADRVVAGMTARMAEIRCPEARLLEMDVSHCQAEAEALIQLLEQASPAVEPHGWGAAYVELGSGGRTRTYAGTPEARSSTNPATAQVSRDITVCREIGRAVRRELGEDLQPALGWDSCKFTALAAAAPSRWPGDRVQPGHLRAIAAPQEKGFLRPLPVTLLPLPGEILQRLCFLGLRTLGQYASLPSAAVWQQFGRAGKLAHRCARGEDDRPIVPRSQNPCLVAGIELDTPLVEQERLVAELSRLVSPLLTDLQGNLQACGKLRLTVQFDDGSTQEKARTFLLPVAEEARILQALGKLLGGLRWQAAASALTVTLEQIQDTVAEQLRLFSLEDVAPVAQTIPHHHEAQSEEPASLREVQRYLASRFKTLSLQRAIIAQPGAPLPEWRIAWLPADLRSMDWMHEDPWPVAAHNAARGSQFAAAWGRADLHHLS
jgi:nucleotidyltransferase/DNA polymerase involved in DNA repair